MSRLRCAQTSQQGNSKKKKIIKTKRFFFNHPPFVRRIPPTHPPCRPCGPAGSSRQTGEELWRSGDPADLQISRGTLPLNQPPPASSPPMKAHVHTVLWYVHLSRPVGRKVSPTPTTRAVGLVSFGTQVEHGFISLLSGF